MAQQICLWRMAARRALKAVLVDLSGTLHVEDSAVPGAQEALKRLRGAPVTVRFVTNTTKECKRDLLERLTKLGFDIAENEIFTSLTAARNLLEQKQVRPLLLVDDKALPDFTGIATHDPNAVVVGLAPEHFNYEMMNKAFRLILDGAPLIAIHKARYFKKKNGLALGPGPFVTGLEYATGTEATVVGKPEKTFFLEALRGTDCAPEEAVMIGDDCRDDVGGAQNAGMRGILVRTGKYVMDRSCRETVVHQSCPGYDSPHAPDRAQVGSEPRASSRLLQMPAVPAVQSTQGLLGDPERIVTEQLVWGLIQQVDFLSCGLAACQAGDCD
uniref:Haloacid dehalogenase-like hydrolase domain-containing protein 2 n=2 Tax=Apteryx owenii TaxID=8824 RepID=A0A8B9NX47_APTOW